MHRFWCHLAALMLENRELCEYDLHTARINHLVVLSTFANVVWSQAATTDYASCMSGDSELYVGRSLTSGTGCLR